MTPRAAHPTAGASLGWRRFRLPPLVLVAILFLLLPLLTRPVGLDVGTEIVQFALYAVAFNLLLGGTGMVSFGHSLFFGLGAYGAGLVEINLIRSVPVALLLCMVLGAAVALVLGALIIRRRGFYFALLTLAFAQMTFTIAYRWTGLTGGEMGLQGIARAPVFGWPIERPGAFYLFTCIVCFAGIAAVYWLLATPFGKTLQGIRENEKRMRMLGCNTTACKLAAFAISAALASLAGGLQGLLFHSAYAQVFDWRSAGSVVVMAVLGGSRYFIGPILGAIIYVFLQQYLSSLTEHWMIVLGAVFILSLIFLPDGVASLHRPLLRRFAPGSGGTRPAEAPYPLAAGHAAQTGGVSAEPLEITGVSKRFGAVVVADRLNLQIGRGQLYSVIGPNGAGKTTLFNILSGLVPLDSGEIKIGERRLEKLTDYERARAGLSRSFQIVSVFHGLTVFENVRLAVQTHRRRGSTVLRTARSMRDVNARAWEILATLGLAPKAAVQADQLPYGDQRLVEIAVTVASEPSVLLLDEPLAGLAEAERSTVAALVRSLVPARTVVLVEHDIDRVLAISEHVAVLNHGHVAATGTPAQIANDPEVLRVYLGAEQHDRRPPGRAVPAPAGKVALAVENLKASYGKSQVLHGVSLQLRRGEIVGLLGRNGVGKTTTAMSIMGALRSRSGTVRLGDLDISRNAPNINNRAGLGLVPQGRRIFPNLTVQENLRVAQIPGHPGRWTEAKAFDIFPRLSERRGQTGGLLSGGEQQLLAIARALMGPLDVLILDEPLEGLAPVMAGLVADTVERLRAENLTVLLIEQAASVALRLVDRVYIMNNGQIIHEGDAAELRDDASRQNRLLGIHA